MLSWCCCSLPCISQILHVQIVSSQFSPSVAQIKNFCSDPGFFLLTMFAKNLTGCFSHCCVEGGDRCIYVSSLLMMVRGANFPPIIAWKVSNTLRSVSFSRLNLSLVCFGLQILLRRRWKIIICKSWSLPMSAPGKLRVLAMFTPDRISSSLECNQSGCGVVHLGYARSISWMLCCKLQRSESSLICVVIAEGSTNALPVSINILAHFCIPVSLHNKNVLLRCLINGIL